MQAHGRSVPRAAVEPAEAAARGIELCRRGDWQEGLYWLSLAADTKGATSELPSLVFAYLGYGLARFQGRQEQGLALCRRSIELEFYQPENYYFLARIHLLAGDRRSAIEAIEGGLQVDSTHVGLTGLRSELGARRSPVLPFLPRRNPLNRTLGRLRHRVLGARRPIGRS